MPTHQSTNKIPKIMVFKQLINLGLTFEVKGVIIKLKQTLRRLKNPNHYSSLLNPPLRSSHIWVEALKYFRN